MKYFLIISLIFLVACSGQPDTNNTSDSDALSYRMDSVKILSSIPPAGSMPFDTAKVVIEYALFADSGIHQMVEEHIASTVDQNEKFSSYRELAESFINRFETYHPEDEGSGAMWFLEMRQKVTYHSKNLVSILNTVYSFEGGAHPNTVYLSYNINPVTHVFLTIDSLIRPEKSDDFLRLAERKFRKNEKISETQSLEENYFFENGQFSLPLSFSVRKNDILFTYSPYEIKPYVFGKTELALTYDEIGDMLRPEYGFLASSK